MIRALIYDLDNTVYPVKAISDELFADLFKLIDNDDTISHTDKQLAKEEVTRRPFQKIADQFGFSDELLQQAKTLISGLTYDKPIPAFDDYRYVRNLKIDKFLVTTGFMRMQTSKVKWLDIQKDFRQIYIVDPETTSKTKKDIFTEILEKYHYSKDEVLVIGDDPESEISEGKFVGLKTVLYDPGRKYQTTEADYQISNHQEITQLLLM